jgi:AcrR family transcriptional regulator
MRTRRGLLKAAKALFVLNGFAGVTVDDICLAAAVSKGCFYHHFPDKESIFLEVASEELRRGMGLSVYPAPNTPAERGESGLLVDLWARAPRCPQVRRAARAVHRQAVKRLSKLPGQVACGPSSTVDRETQALLALLMDIGQVVQRATAPRPATGERERRKAAAG